LSAVVRPGGVPGRLLGEARVVEQRRPGGGYLGLVVRSPDVAAAARPGQFAMLRAWPGWDPLLPRPFSFARLDPERGTCEFLYRVVGRGTELLARLQPGDPVTVLAPLGEPFPLPERGRIALVGRGLGIAPLIAVADLASGRGLAVDAYLSARQADHVPGLDALRATCDDVFVQADDRPGRHPLATGHLEEELERRRYAAAYTCGSRRLAVALQRLQALHGFRAWVSLETHMACGFGACRACVWPVRCGDEPAGGGAPVHLVRTCLEGPAFPLERVVYEP
jgi:dihydroorotate dehydrogenase electron transfer subunit